MRFLLAVLAVLGMTIAAGDLAQVAAADSGHVLALEQQPGSGTLDVNINVDEGEWWANPVWIGVGIVALILLIVIVAMATRGGGTTIIKD